jgi:hypothetical protein
MKFKSFLMLCVVLCLFVFTEKAESQTKFDNATGTLGSSDAGVVAPSFVVTFSSLDSANKTHSEWKPQIAWIMPTDTSTSTMAVYFNGAATDTVQITIDAMMNGNTSLVYASWTSPRIPGATSPVALAYRIYGVAFGDTYRITVDPIATQSTKNAAGSTCIVGLTAGHLPFIGPKLHWNDKY